VLMVGNYRGSSLMPCLLLDVIAYPTSIFVLQRQTVSDPRDAVEAVVTARPFNGEGIAVPPPCTYAHRPAIQIRLEDVGPVFGAERDLLFGPFLTHPAAQNYRVIARRSRQIGSIGRCLD